jgi:hypothetical protein
MMIEIPGTEAQIRPGCTVKIGRFSEDNWNVYYGWYSWGGNREVLGWYLLKESDANILKPLQRPDLIDIYLIKNG